MTRVGKIFLLIQVALSLLFAFWGIGIYTNHVNWTNQKKGDLEGEFSIRETQMRNLNTRRSEAETRLDTAHQVVLTLEMRRPELLSWYAQKFKHLREEQGAVEDIKRVDDVVQKGPDEKLLFDPAPGLFTLPDMHKMYVKKQADIEAVLKARDLLTKEEKRLSDQLKGLRVALAAEQEEAAKAQKEQDWLEPLLYNQLVELQSLTNRQKQLQAHLKELPSGTAKE